MLGRGVWGGHGAWCVRGEGSVVDDAPWRREDMYSLDEDEYMGTLTTHWRLAFKDSHGFPRTDEWADDVC